MAPAAAHRSSSSWTGSSPERTWLATTSVGARSSLAAASGPGGLLERGQRLGPDHAEAPRVGEVVVRRPARQLEQLLERLARHRLGCRRPCACGACGWRLPTPWAR